jgi:SNF2 family DNA or RNA helicase
MIEFFKEAWPRSKLRQFQLAAALFIREIKRVALFIDMGLGKTAAVLTAICDLVFEMEVGRILIVGPPRVVKHTWPEEIQTWAHTRGLTFTQIDGPPKRRLKRLTEATDIHFISCDLLPWLSDLIADIHEYDMIVVDESSKFKSPDTNRTKALHRMAPRAEYVVELTGTPAPNGLHDLWAQIYALDRGYRLGHTITAFRDRWFEQNWDGNAYREKDHAEEAIRSRIEDICFTLRDSDYAELPPRIDNMIWLELEDEVRTSYDKFKKTYILEIEEDRIKAVTAAALTNKLLQLSNGVVYDKDRKEHFFHKLKIEALQDIVEEAAGQPVLVAYNFLTDVKAIKAAFPKAVLLDNNPQTIKDWNEGRIQMLIAHPKSAGHGLNLQHGGSIAVWYGLTYSLEDYMQFNKRLHRPGQTRPVIIHHLLCKNTIDEHVLAALQGKDKIQNALLDALRRIIEDVKREEEFQ